MFRTITKITLLTNTYDNSYLHNLNFFSAPFMKMCYFAVGLCTLPTNWDGDWYDSGMGEIQMSERTKTVTSGWDVSVSTTSLTSWSCVTSNDTGSYLLFKYISKLLAGSKYFSNSIWMNVGCSLIQDLISLLEYFRSDQLVDYNGTFYNAFRCIQWTKITYNSYMYYPMTGKVKQN